MPISPLRSHWDILMEQAVLPTMIANASKVRTSPHQSRVGARGIWRKSFTLMMAVESGVADV